MEFIVGIDKFPLVRVEANKYAHIFPVTKYQFERYIWEKAPNINYEMMIQKNERIPPDEINMRNLDQLFITGISFNEAFLFAKWLGGRLPSIRELERLTAHLSGIKIRELFEKTSKEKSLDERWFAILNKLCISTIADLFKNIRMEELCSKDAYVPEGEIYLRRVNGSHCSPLVGERPPDVQGEFGFRVIRREDDS